MATFCTSESDSVKDQSKASIVAMGIALAFFAAPGVYLLTGITLETGEYQGAPNWGRALVGVPFTLFGLLLFGCGLLIGIGRNWRVLALVGMLVIFPAITLLLGWPAVQVPIPLGMGRQVIPGVASYFVRIVFGAASIAFAYAAFLLWWSVLSGRVGTQDIRGV